LEFVGAKVTLGSKDHPSRAINR
jgi:hypothetical protein